MTLGFLNWPAAFPFRVFRNLTFAHIQDIFAIFDFEDEMFVEVFPWIDNIQKHAWYCKQLNRSYWGPKVREKNFDSIYFNRKCFLLPSRRKKCWAKVQTSEEANYWLRAGCYLCQKSLTRTRLLIELGEGSHVLPKWP